MTGEKAMYLKKMTSISKYENSESEIGVCIKEISLGNKDALTHLYEQTRVALFGFVLSILKNSYDAEDVLQETYITIHNKASQYKDNGKAMAWIFTIARNLSLMKIRSNKKNIFLDEEWEKNIPDTPLVNNDDKIMLKLFIEKLTAEERQIIIMHIVGGLKHREIAKILDLSLATTLSKYHRALKKLKKMMEDD